MSYNPCIDIDTESGENILRYDFSDFSLERKLFDMISDLVNQGLASYTEKTVDLYYPAVVNVHKATDSVKKMLLPIVEEIATIDSGLYMSRSHYERTANDENLKKEHERWKATIENAERRIATGLEALKSFPDDERFIITAWGTL